MALFAGMRHAEPLAGIVALSGYELLSATREVECTEANRATLLLVCHGSHDPLVGVARGRRAFAAYSAGRSAAWHEFPMEHAMCLEEVEVIRDWLRIRYGSP